MTTTVTLTAAVIARDEERMLGDCLQSVEFADERLVLIDTATRDRTREIALQHGARVVERPFDNFAAQRDAALSLATSEWVLFVDADERVPAALGEEVLRSIAAPQGQRGFWVPRHNYLMGRLVRNAGWFPDYQLRLLERRAAHFDARRVVHELAIVDGPVGHLREPFVHYNYRSVGEFIFKQERYCRLEAERWFGTYGRPRLRAVVGQPLREFWRRYISLRGYREGLLGLLLSALLAYYAGKAVWLARRLP
ncbi:MAG TPA: glycosyltransferase family 2 protein [Chloroflexota bacterium]|jgi:glycosyltransferase involved in cell wall biosynthesis|nr:glycosyltransferase family 2 protein [Chloroflexota bacterium]